MTNNALSARSGVILLVEDYAANALVAATFLEGFGYSCDTASSGAEALEKFTAGSYALILMDINMHGINGIEATRLIRDEEITGDRPRTPIIGMSAYLGAEDRAACLSAGMDDFVTKPFDTNELKNKIFSLTPRTDGHGRNYGTA
jgi:CheY-like chemotaxis protein